MVNPYIGHESQLCGVEEVRLVGGKGDGMRLLQIRNAAGLQMSVSADRCADISRLIFKGDNMGYFSPNGYVAPAYYDEPGAGFLKSFTAGFLTTCGLTAVGSPCTDEGEDLPLHGTIGNTPCERIWWDEDDKNIYIHAIVNDSGIFARKFYMKRTITVSKEEGKFTITDTVDNQGDSASPVMLLYHMNMGYPLLSENSLVEIPSVSVKPRNDHAAKDLSTWHKMLPPTPGFEEQCYFHSFENEGKASIYNPDIHKGLTISFDPHSLDHFTEWKMMGYRDYVLGLEPGNCHPDGRDVMRKEGKLKFLQPGEAVTYEVTVTLYEK
ncbi:MAG: aldose 1-epimerase family protein [Oscillospiraceae bacterium]|nr:aldose 1-epimerase family protein [Oscillospiraceae bacterium]